MMIHFEKPKKRQSKFKAEFIYFFVIEQAVFSNLPKLD